jgi:hypothetical protein
MLRQGTRNDIDRKPPVSGSSARRQVRPLIINLHVELEDTGIHVFTTQTCCHALPYSVWDSKRI